MSDIAIQVRGLGKEYRIGHQTRRKTFREAITDAALAPIRRIRQPLNPQGQDSFWALKDVNFDVKKGEVLGIIGRNGAGKSTLLKILSRITDPSEGEIEITGRVGSLLEVGTGFHPELTGRENIYLNGAILGMKRTEISSKFDEIIAFSEVEKFLDTPVKHYSSGMYMRLAFAVAAHLEPEILVVDEVLAVGDIEFQKKCLGKMGEVARGGRTVLFVSHNMPAVEQLCSSIGWLERGTMREQGPEVARVIRNYMTGTASQSLATAWCNNENILQDPGFSARRFELVDAEGRPLPSPVRNDQEVWVQIEGMAGPYDPALQIGYGLFSEYGTCVYYSVTTDADPSVWPKLEPGMVRLRSKLAPRLLNEGDYRLELVVVYHNRSWVSQPGKNAPSITLSIRGGISDSPYYRERRESQLAPIFPWERIA